MGYQETSIAQKARCGALTLDGVKVCRPGAYDRLRQMRISRLQRLFNVPPPPSKRGPDRRRTPVYCVDADWVYDEFASIRAAAAAWDIHPKHLSAAMQRGWKVRGMVWGYVNEATPTPSPHNAQPRDRASRRSGRRGAQDAAALRAGALAGVSETTEQEEVSV